MYIGIGIVLIAGLFLLYGFCGNNLLTTEQYQLSSGKLEKDTVMVLLTDLHTCSHGRKNEKLLQKIKESRADFICIAGDMVVKNGKRTAEVVSFIKKLVVEYPVYYSPGNHEIRMLEYEKYREELRRAGVIYLENESVETEGGICITGLDLPEYWYHKVWQKREFTVSEMTHLLGKCRQDCYTVLLAHNPEYFRQYAGWGADLTLSGHLHGGIARLPFLGGVISPSLRLFPAYDAGKFERQGRYMIVSRGLGLHHIKLRFFNRPEVSVINLTCHLKGK